jgi:AraC-like DNA-binding protein
MCDLGVNPDNFNPRVLFAVKGKYNNMNKLTFDTHDFIELKYILSGSCTYNIRNEIFHVKKGDIIVCNPGIAHIKSFNQNEELIEFNAGFNNICLKNLPKDCLIAENECPVISLTKYEQDFFKCCNELVAEQERNEPGFDLLLKSLLMKLIVIFLKETYYKENGDSEFCINFESHDKSSIVNTVISYITENYMNEISLESISRNMYLSPVYISKVFKEETGDSPINYLIKTRLSKAKEILELGGISIKTAAKTVGYHDAYHFSKLFKKHYGYPPSDVIK